MDPLRTECKLKTLSPEKLCSYAELRNLTDKCWELVDPCLRNHSVRISPLSWCSINPRGKDRRCPGKGSGNVTDKSLTVFRNRVLAATSSFDHFIPFTV